MSSNEHLFKIAEAGEGNEGNEHHGGAAAGGGALLSGPGATTATPGVALYGGENEGISELRGGNGDDTLYGTGGNLTLVGGAGTNTFNVQAGEDTLADARPGSDHINVSSGATAVLNLTSSTANANLSTATTNNSGTLLINAAPATTSTIMGSRGSDDIRGGTGTVNVRESEGNDHITGGSGGINAVAYTGNESSYHLNQNANGALLVQKPTGTTDTLNSVQRIQFANTKVAMDINGHAGMTAKVIGAVFGAGAVSNPTYVGIGLHELDGGTSYTGLMQLALNAAGATTSAAEVDLLWHNLFHAAPTAAQAAPYIAMLNSGSTTAAALGTMAADTSVNTANINLVGLQHTGIHYA